MEKYVAGNKEAWEEAFDHRDPSWGADIVQRVREEEYPFFYEDLKAVLKGLPTEGAVIGQFCCNNGRELLSLVKSGKAARGIGFDIAENQVAFAREKAAELELPCAFEAINIYDIGDQYKEMFDIVLITIGALCWFKDLNRFFEIVAECMKTGSTMVIHECHPCVNMIAAEGEDEYDAAHRLECKYSYFDNVWTGNDGIYYMTKKEYPSKTFTDFTHSMGEIITGMCSNGLVVTGLQEYDYDISEGFSGAEKQGFPLSMIITGRKDG